MSTTVAVLAVVTALSILGVSLKRRDRKKIWVIGRRTSLDREEFEFSFRVGFDDESVASAFLKAVSEPSVGLSLEQPKPGRWVVVGKTTTIADGIWYQAILGKWRRTIDESTAPGETIMVMASKPGSATGFFLSTEAAS